MIRNELIQIYIDLLTKIRNELILGFLLMKWFKLSITNRCKFEFIMIQHLTTTNALDIWNEMITLYVTVKQAFNKLNPLTALIRGIDGVKLRGLNHQ